MCNNMKTKTPFFGGGLLGSGVRAMAIRVIRGNTNRPFTAQRVNNLNGMSFGDL